MIFFFFSEYLFKSRFETYFLCYMWSCFKPIGIFGPRTSSPLHLQHCHLFKTITPGQAEDRNVLIGNTFRIAYASQIQEEYVLRENESVLPVFWSCRSADSLLKCTQQKDLGIIADEPVYKIPDYNQASRLRHTQHCHVFKTSIPN